MNALPEPLKQLVERRLWPVALLLVAALAAVPLLLASKDSVAGAVPAATSVAASDQSPAQSVVSLADPAKRDAARSVLGDRKDPFRPAQINRVPKAPDAGAAGAGTSLAPSVGTGSTGGAGAGSGGGGGAPTPPLDTPPVATPPGVSPPEPPKQTFDLYSLEVRFGSTDGELGTQEVKRLTGLPRGPQPVVVYLGLLENHKSAVFIVDAGVTALGDGACDPAPDDCQRLTLKAGETEFLTRGDQQYELDLVKVHTSKTANAGEAKASRTAVAAGGRKALRARQARASAYRYSERSGTLKARKRAEPWARAGKLGLPASRFGAGSDGALSP